MHFSVIIPLFNKERHISRAISSVIHQTVKDFEIIIVNDGSTDSSIEKVLNFSDSRIKLINQTNAGVSAARNRGISMANNEYICFLDADDAWKEDFLENIVVLVKNFPQVGAYATGYEIIQSSNKKAISKRIGNLKNGVGVINYFKESMDSPLISASSIMIPKFTFSKVGAFKEYLKRGEDLEMWMRIALNFEIAYTNKVCATYFMDSDNRSINSTYDLSSAFIGYVEEILENEYDLSIEKKYFKEYMISRIIVKARYFIKCKESKKARKLLLKYKYTKYNKKKIIKAFVKSYLP